MIWPAFDEQLFYYIHHDLANPFLDTLLPVWREKTTWVPAYLVAAAYLVYKYKRQGWQLLLLIGLAILLSDQLTSSIIKPLTERPRPCYLPAFEGQLRELVPCGGYNSFPSSHAANHFALATVLLLTWLKGSRLWAWILLLWATSICFAQVYVAKHYPLDVLVGALMGTLIAYGLVKYSQLWKPDSKV